MTLAEAAALRAHVAPWLARWEGREPGPLLTPWPCPEVRLGHVAPDPGRALSAADAAAVEAVSLLFADHSAASDAPLHLVAVVVAALRGKATPAGARVDRALAMLSALWRECGAQSAAPGPVVDAILRATIILSNRMADELGHGRARPLQVADLLAALLPHAPAVSWERLALEVDISAFLSLARAVWHRPVDWGGPGGGGHLAVSALLTPLLADPHRRRRLLAALASGVEAHDVGPAAQIAAVLGTCPPDPAVVRPLLRLLLLSAASSGSCEEPGPALTGPAPRELDVLLRALGGEVLCTRLMAHWPAGMAAAIAEGALAPQALLPRPSDDGAWRPKATSSPERRRSPARREPLARPRGFWYHWSRDLRQSVETRGMGSRLRPRRMEEPRPDPPPSPAPRAAQPTGSSPRAPLWRRSASVAGTLQGFARISAVYAGMPEKFEPHAQPSAPVTPDPLHRALARACAARIHAVRCTAGLVRELERAAAASIRVSPALQGAVRTVGDAVLRESEGGGEGTVGASCRDSSAAPSPWVPALVAVQKAALSDNASTRTSAAAALTAILRMPPLCSPCRRLRAAVADGVHRATRGEAPTSGLPPALASRPVHCAVWWTVAALAHPDTPASAAWVASRAVSAAAAARMATAEDCAQQAPLWASQAAALLVQTAGAALEEEGSGPSAPEPEPWRRSTEESTPPSHASLFSVRSGASLRSGIGEPAPHSERGATLRYTTATDLRSWHQPGAAAGGRHPGLESASALVRAYTWRWVAFATLPTLQEGGAGVVRGAVDAQEQLPPLPAPSALRDAVRAEPGPASRSVEQWQKLGRCCARAAAGACNAGSAAGGAPALAGLRGVPAALHSRDGLRAASSVLDAFARSATVSDQTSICAQLDVVAGLWSDALAHHCVDPASLRLGPRPDAGRGTRGPVVWRSAAVASLQAAAGVEPLLARAVRGAAGNVAAAAAAAWCVRWCAAQRPNAYAEGVLWALGACQAIVRDLEDRDPSFVPPTADHVLAVHVAALATAS